MKRIKWIIAIILVLLVAGGISAKVRWDKHKQDEEYRNDWVTRAMESGEVSTLKEEYIDQYVYQTIDHWCSEGGSLSEFIAHLGEKWGLTEADQLAILRRVLEMMNEVSDKRR